MNHDHDDQRNAAVVQHRAITFYAFEITRYAVNRGMERRQGNI